MLRRLPGLFDRFAAARLMAARPGPTLRGPDGAALGRVARIAREGRRLVVEGEARAAAATLAQGAARDARRLGPDGAFALSLPGDGTGPVTLALDLDGGPAGTVLRPPSAALARARLWPAFALAALRAAPDAWAWRRTRDPARRARVRRALGLDLGARAQALDPATLVPPGPLPRPERPLIVVLPVYQAREMLAEALDRLERHTDLPWRLVLVEDASPDPTLRPWLLARAEALRTGGVGVEVLENPRNLGFVGSVNRGLARAREIDPGAVVVLLNSDAMVPAAWAPRLLAPLLADPGVASVTPMSNDAEILSAPAICARLDLAPGQADALDREALRLDPVAAAAALPTGVGFCMALSPRALDRVPSLDPAFGRGYGEEVDWCQRLRAEGFSHLGTAGLFVEHRGGGSFGSEAKRALIAANGETISRRYPRYDGEVQAFIEEDPLATPRLALGLAWAAGAAAARPGSPLVPVVLAHVMGGGAEMATRRRIAENLGRGLPSVVLRVGGRARWGLELHAPGGVTAGVTDDGDLVRRLLEPLTRRRIVYACGVSDPDPVTLPALLLSLADGATEAEVEVELHDYFAVSPSFTLLPARGAFAGPVAPGRPGSDDPAHTLMRPDGSRVTLAAWQDAWRPLVARARVTAYSEASADLLRAAYPEARIAVRPHAALTDVEPVARPEGPRVLGLLGNLNAHKGGGLAVALARLAAAEPGPISRVVLVGDLDPEMVRPRSLTVHGPYAHGDIAALARRYRITDWLIPSLWPETFSFTTREALATGLPTFAFAIGAQGEAVAEAANGRPLPAALLATGPDARAVRMAIEAA